MIRPMAAEDVPVIAEMEKICFALPWSRESLEAELGNPCAYYAVMTHEGEIVAYAGMWLIIDEAHITNIAVRPEYRRKSFATAMLAHMMEKARSEGINDMTLEVRPSNAPALALYYGMGFEQSGVRRRYYPDTGEDALILWNRDINATLGLLEQKQAR